MKSAKLLEMDLQDRNNKIVQYQALVHKIACRLWNSSALARRAGSLDALVSSGNLGLLDAVRLHDESRGANFMTYAYACIRGRMLRDAGQEAIIRLPEKVRMAMAGFKGSKRFLSQATKTKRVRHLCTNEDWLVAPEQDLDGQMDSHEKVSACLKTLSQEDQDLVTHRFGLEGHPPLLLRQLATHLGVSKEAVRQRLVVVLRKLRRRCVKETS